MKYKNTYKPNYTSFVIYPFILWILFVSFILAVLYTASYFFFPIHPIWGIGLLTGIAALSFYSRHVQYNKESVVFKADRIAYYSGGIFSDNETDLIIHNITHVIMNKPFIENGLFKTGSLLVQSAGSGEEELKIRHIDNPEEAYKRIQTDMRQNGFLLDTENLVQEEKPHILGIFFEIFQGFLGTLISLFFFFSYLSGVIYPYISPYLDLIVPLIIGFLIIQVIPTIFRFLDLKQRVYRVYTNTITYSEGFLNKQEAFLPMENLSDSTVSQTFIDRIFSLYDVIISCQGSNQEIVFKNMANGPKLEKNIDTLTKDLESLVSKGGGKPTETDETEQQSSLTHKQVTSVPHTPITRDEAFTAEYTMDMTKIIVSNAILLPGALILFPLLFPWIVKVISDMIKAASTTYRIRERTIQEQFSFFNKKTREFSIDKVMGIQVRESVIDTWFSTCSITFWSIGSTETITFQSIKKTDTLISDIRSKFGYVTEEKPMYKLRSNFTVVAMLAWGLIGTIIAAIIVAVSLLVAWVQTGWMYIPAIVIVMFFVGMALYNRVLYKRSHLAIYPHFIQFRQGLLIKEQIFVLLDNIKDITTVKYPFIHKGHIQFNIAGEKTVQTGKSTMVISNTCTIRYIDAISTKDELLDLIFYKRPNTEDVEKIVQNIKSYHEKPILVAQPSVANAVTSVLLINVILFPLILLLPITLIWTIWAVKVTRYSLESYRVVVKSGVIFKKQTSIISHKIDHLNKEQGMFNKIYRNGTVTIYTVGSSQPELELKNMPNYEEVYEELHKQYL